VNLKDINAFALPGGPMFVQRGMFDAAAEEAEVAGVMAHELSRVLLRHGTANASKAQNPWLQLGQIAGAVVGGELGGYIAEGTQFGLGTLLLRYSRNYEKQADLLGAQIMARAGYDPRALAHAPSRSASIRLNKTATWFQMALFWSHHLNRCESRSRSRFRGASQLSSCVGARFAVREVRLARATVPRSRTPDA
jgi:predicted Zn-dependent protease